MSPQHTSPTTEAAEKRVESLVRKYRLPTSPSPLLTQVYNDPDSYSTLVSALRRQTALSKSRSQDFEDCQVTAYDKALLILSNEGESATDPAALEFYLAEFLGVAPSSPVEDGMDVVKDNAELQGLVQKIQGHGDGEVARTKTLKREREDTSSPFDIEEYERNYSEPLHYGEDESNEKEHIKPEHTAFSRQAQAQAQGHAQDRKPDVRVARLLEVYNKAKDDYFTIKKQEGLENLAALRFLRDSAENALRYFRANGMADSVYASDLEHTFAIARDKTAHILGGHQRHFDEDYVGSGTRAKDRRRRRRGSSAGVTKKGGKRHGHGRRIIDSYRPNGGHH